MMVVLMFLMVMMVVMLMFLFWFSQYLQGLVAYILVTQDACHLWVDVFWLPIFADLDVSHQEVFATCDGPNMKVVNWYDALNFREFGSQLGWVYAGGLSFHQYIHAVFENWDRRNNDKNREKVSADGISNFSSGPFPNDERCDNDSNRLEHVPNNMDYGCSDVDIFLLAMVVIRMRIFMVVMHERLRSFLRLVIVMMLMFRGVIMGMLMMIVRMRTSAGMLMMGVVFAVMLLRACLTTTVRFVDTRNRVEEIVRVATFLTAR